MNKKLVVTAATVVLSLTLAGCHSYDYRYSDGAGYVYDDWGYGGYGWEPYPAFSLSYYRYHDSPRRSHRHHRHHRR